ncbi:MAG: hypothetical protein K0V04_45485 [Deltaproteobacteria bacterium]|nr:hypothetical protein [Deltaproteobacteria bacterium]
MSASSSKLWWQRPRFWALLLALIVLAINLASMGTTGAWDPWETHYGEVARQIVVRHDPIDLWWHAGNGGPDATTETTFWSKPVLPFWLMALSMKVFGVGAGPDPAELVQPFWPEFALRLPSMIAGLGSAALLGFVAWRQVSPRAGIVTAVVLVTMPQWAIASRQALTDMIFMGPVVLAVAAWMLAWGEPDRPLRRRGTGVRSVPWDRAYLMFVVVLVIAAIVPLAVIHQHSFDPGAWARVGRSPKFAQGLRDIQSHMFIYWGLVVLVLGRSLRWKRRSEAWMGVMYLAAGLSLIGKGLIGPGLIGAVVLVHLVVSGRWDLLRRCGLPTGIALFALAGFPWHHAMVLFRGERWINELIIQNNLARFGTGEQKQAVGSFGFYLETLGLAALPWSAVVPLALGTAFGMFGRRSSATSDPSSDSEGDSSAARGDAVSNASPAVAGDPASADAASGDGAAVVANAVPDRAAAEGPSDAAARDGAATGSDAPFEDYAIARTPEQRRRALHQFALLWFAVSLFAIGYSVTKYYHYLLPCLPPLALLIGLWIEDRLSRKSSSRTTLVVGALVGVAILVAVIRDASHTTAWLAHLTTYLYTGMWRTGGPGVHALPWLVLPFAVGLILWVAWRRRAALAAFVLSGLLTTGWVIVDYLPAASENWSQRTGIRMYYDQRAPDDRLVSWWFYYRGETWFSKGDVWVMKDHNRKELAELFTEYEGRGASLWFITVEPHARRLQGQIPQKYRGSVEVMHESFHYVLLRVHVP